MICYMTWYTILYVVMICIIILASDFIHSLIYFLLFKIFISLMNFLYHFLLNSSVKMYYLSFCLSEEYLYLLSFLKNSFVGYSSLSWQILFSFNTMKFSCYSFLAHHVSVKSTVKWIVKPICIVCFFSLEVLRISIFYL